MTENTLNPKALEAAVNTADKVICDISMDASIRLTRPEMQTISTAISTAYLTTAAETPEVVEDVADAIANKINDELHEGKITQLVICTQKKPESRLWRWRGGDDEAHKYLPA